MSTRPPILRLTLDEQELIVDNFAGGGGASVGIERATGRSPDIAINHDREALAMHRANHPTTRHLCEDVFDVDPRTVCSGRPVGLAHFSPDCTFHSKARGGKPHRDRDRARRRRGLAWIVVKWAVEVRPRVITLENVEEFEDWGPLDEDGRPDPARRGLSFRRWVARLRNLGYAVEWRELRACDYGAPTSRKRLFVVARCDGRPIAWPEPTHGKGRAQPYRTAAECIDWSIPCPSIFDRKRPLAENTLRRIARGIRKYVLESASPFIVPLQRETVAPFIARIGQTGGGGAYVNSVGEPVTTVTTKAEHLLVAPSLIQTSWGEREGQAPRVLDLHAPLGTIVGGGIKHGLVCAFLAKHFGGEHATGAAKGGDGAQVEMPLSTITARDHHALVAAHLLKLRGGLDDHPNTSQALDQPVPTITASGTHYAQVCAFLIAYYGSDQNPQLGLPLPTVTTKHRLGLVTVHGVDYAIVDIGMRMLEPPELARAQGFDDDYVLAPVVDGKPLTKTAQVRMLGNSVPPHVEAALVHAQLAAPAAREEVA